MSQYRAMNRMERLDRSFMEPSELNTFGLEVTEVIAPHPRYPMPGDEEARLGVAAKMRRSRDYRWRVEFDRGPVDARKRYPEAY